MMFQLPDRHGVVFANVGSTGEVPIWEDFLALVHWQLHRCSDAEEKVLMGLVLRECREAGAGCASDFYEGALRVAAIGR